MGIFLKEMFGGQQRVTPDRILEPRYTGKTIFTAKAPVPLVQRLAAVIIAAGGAAMALIILGLLSSLTGFIIVSLRLLALLVFGLNVFFCFLALFGLPPFQSKKTLT